MFVPPDPVTVTLDLPAAARWVAETYDCTDLQETDGRVRVTLRVVGEVWLERLLLRLGPQARVVEPPDWAGLAPAAASRLLARYR